MKKQIVFFGSLLISAGFTLFSAELKLGTPFLSGMILQRDKSVPVWGTAEPGAEVKVSFKEQSVSGKAGADGRWLVRLKPLAADGKGATLSVRSGKSVKTLQNVIVGEVWICFGQSHIEAAASTKIRELKSFDKKTTTPETRKKLLAEMEARPRTVAADPQLRYCRLWLNETAAWRSLTPKTVLDWNLFGLELALKLRRELNVPVGIINIARGCSSIESWLPEEVFTSPVLTSEKKYIKPFKKFYQGYTAKKLSAQEISDVFTAYCKDPKREQRSHLKNGKADPKAYSWLWQHMRAVTPTSNYDAALKHFTPFAIRGLIWWQGGTNYKDRPMVYDRQLAILVDVCRKDWKEPDLPFITILQGQSKLFMNPSRSFSDLRALQFQAADKLSRFWLVNNVETPMEEVGMVHPIHEKIRAGQDTAELVLSILYGGKRLGSGPLLDSAEYRDGKAIFSFRFGKGLKTRSGKAPQGFELAGADRKFYPAQAKIENGKIVAVSSKVAKPCYGRFLWHTLSMTDLVNENDLTAFPFDTTLPVFQKKNSINMK